MAKDLDDIAWEQICARVLGHEVPNAPEISAATLLAAKPKPDAWQWNTVGAVPKPPSGAGKSDSDKGTAS